jgi:hypothetical protein
VRTWLLFLTRALGEVRAVKREKLRTWLLSLTLHGTMLWGPGNSENRKLTHQAFVLKEKNHSLTERSPQEHVA